MADRSRMTAAQLVDKLLASDHADVLRDSIAWLVAELMDAEVARLTGAELGERAPERRTTQRNGYRPRSWDTRVGQLELAIPKLRQGSYFPGFLEPRRRAEQALVAVVQEAYVNGISTRKVDRLVAQLGLQGMSKDQVSRLCRGLDEQVRSFRERPLEGGYPYLWLDAKVERVREPGGVRHKALVIAYGVHQTGRREVIGIDVGEAETEAFWREFLRGLRARGLAGVKLCVSDAHEGLKQAIAKVLGCPWQRCTVHWACADSSWWPAGGRCGVVGGDQGEHLRLAAKPHGRGWELEAVFLQQGEHVVDRVADGATAHVKQVGQCALGADLPQVQDGGQDPFRVGDLLLEDAPSGARQPVPAPALVAAPLDQGGLPDRQALHQQIQVGARHAGQGWIGQLLMTA